MILVMFNKMTHTSLHLLAMVYVFYTTGNTAGIDTHVCSLLTPITRIPCRTEGAQRNM